MTFIGIDIASTKHDCCILGPDKKERASFTFSNDCAGFARFFREATQFDTPEQIRIGLEATGVYGDTLRQFLREKGFEVCTFNPLIVKNRHSGTTLRKTKTDVTDAKFIAQLVSTADFQPDQYTSYHTSELKSLSRARFHLVQQRSGLKNKVKSNLHSLFPEFILYFSDVFGASASAVLSRFPSARDLAACSVKTLAELLRKASRGRYGREKAAALIEGAQNSIGVYSAARALELQMMVEQIELYSKHIAKFDKKIRFVFQQTDSTITSVPGIGTTLGAMILGEIGCIERFANPGKLLAFAGLEPSIYQSGKFTPASGKMVKRGSPYLRYSLMQAARLVSRYDMTFALYLKKKQEEGKSYQVATSHVAKKLVRILHSLLKNNSAYSTYYSPIAS